MTVSILADAHLQHLGESQEAGAGGRIHVEAAGVEVTLSNMEWNAYQVAKDSGDFMLARSFLFGDYVEPSAMLNSFRCQDPQNEWLLQPDFRRLAAAGG